jgi:serine/threonine-protein kinase
VSEQIPGLPENIGAGSFVAGYRLEERIGQGGMAAVFRAYDQRLERLVALKILAPALASDDAFRQRFIRESRAAAAVDDPHIIPVYAAGESEGVLFIAMRLVRGGDVLSLIDRTGPLPAGRAAEIITQAASALDAAHARGLVHRDVKPANMLLEASQVIDRPDHVYLSDFGLSKASLAVTGLTATGQFLGTLDYVAPEQIEGRPVDGRTDQYGLACAAFELLAGEPPFRRRDSVSVMYAQLNEAPPPLRPRRPDLPDAIDPVLARALAKSAADRFDSCREFAAALRLALGPGGSAHGAPAHPVTEVTEVAAARPDRELAPAGQTPGKGQTEASDYRPAATDPALADPELADRALADRALADRALADRALADRALADRALADRALADRALADRALAGPATAEATSPVPRSDRTSAGLVGRRPWWRSPAPVTGLCVAALLAGGGAYALAGHKGAGQSGLASLSLPHCTTRTAVAPTLTGVRSAAVTTGGDPFGIAVTADGQYTLVSLGNSIEVLRNSAGLAPVPVRTIAADHASKTETLTPDGRYLLAAAGSGAVVINVAEAIQGGPDPIVGSLTSPDGGGAFQVLTSPDGKYAFVTLQNSGKLAVFDLRYALTQGFTSGDFIGYVPLGSQPVGMASRDGLIYVANIGGTLSVVGMQKAETRPAAAVVATAPAGCGPARALLSADGSVLWVTDRQSDELLGFSTARLVSDPRHALIARVMVGEVPLGETFADGGRRIVVADSNLNGLRTAAANLAIVDTASALAGRPALLGYVPTGLLPRAVVVEPGGTTLLVSDQNAGQVQALRLASLP